MLQRRGPLLGLAARAIHARYVEPFLPRIERVGMDFPQLPRSLEGLRIVQVSDLHVSGRATAQYLRHALQVCVDLRPDLVVITGDFLTRARLRHIVRVERLVGMLRAPLGVYAVLGNHDYHVFRSGRRLRVVPRREMAERLARGLERRGVQVLRNAARGIPVGSAGLQVVGLDDWWSGLYDSRRAFAHVDPKLPCIALSHNPEAIQDLKHWPCHWILAGHTHGGQVHLPRLGRVFLPRRLRRYAAGLYRVGQQRLYVNCGLGYVVQLRFNCRPEITEFTLTRSA